MIKPIFDRSASWPAMNSHVAIVITDESAIGEARRTAGNLAAGTKLSSADAGRAAVVASELATNLLRHARPAGGKILIAAVGDNAIEITSLDNGPGMADVARCFRDGYSTGGTPGNGLGAVRRMSDELDLFSNPAGTALWCRIVAGGGPSGNAPAPAAPRMAGISVPAPLEEVCGDAWEIARSPDGAAAIVLADGLGHGPEAALASRAAVSAFQHNPFSPPDMLLETMHRQLGGTRGAAVAVTRVDRSAGRILHAGVGNIAGTLIASDNSTRGLFSHNGTVGHLARKFQSFEYPWTPASTLVLHSDGLQSRWSLERYAGLTRCHPAVIAGVLFRDFQRGRDDATVVVVSCSQ